MGNLMGWESRLEESGFRELGSDCEHLTKEFGLYSWVSIIQWWFPPPHPQWWLLSGYNQICVPGRSFYKHVEDGMKRKEPEGEDAK